MAALHTLPLQQPRPVAPREASRGVEPPALADVSRGMEPPAPAVTVRDLGPADGGLLDAIHAGLSAQSRYQRYHGAKPRLSARERGFFTATDGRDHVALVALEGGVTPVGVARYVRLADDPRAADIAAEVVDRRQRQGLGSDLIGRVARRAAAAGIERLTATVLSETGLRAALVRRGWRVRSFDGPTTTLEADVWTLLRTASR
jgi:GNAT superfamily N-acetyltransferase